MCLLVMAWQVHPEQRLLFAGNRAEFHQRPARSAQWWPDAPGVLAGRDLQAGGTWLGADREGRFAVVTNFREPVTETRGGSPSIRHLSFQTGAKQASGLRMVFASQSGSSRR